MKKTTVLFFACLITFSFFNSCKDRFFDNPWDPDKEERGYDIVSIISIGGHQILDMTFSDDSIWIINHQKRLISLDFHSGSSIRELTPGDGIKADGICYDGSDLWIHRINSSHLIKINIINGETLRTISLTQGEYQFMDFHDSTLYVYDRTSNTIRLVNPEGEETISSISSPAFQIAGLCYDGTHIWVLDPTTTRLFRLESSGEVLNIYQTPGKNPGGLCFSNGYIWCGDLSGKIYKMSFL